MCKKFVLIYFFVFALVCSACGSNNPELISDNLQDDSEEAFRLDETSEEPYLENVKCTEDIANYNVEIEVPVYVCGAVNSPGVYYLSANSIKADALLAAGGFSEDAIEEAVNLAEGLSEGEKIYFPRVGDDITWSKSDNNVDTLQPSSEKININEATKEELLTLPGIGESKARDIIDYRNSNGPFKDISEIMNIAGIKEGVYNKIKDSIEVR